MEANITNSVMIKSSYAEILSSFNTDLQSAIDHALQRYLIDQVATRIAGLRNKDNAFQSKYGCDYNTFSLRISEDDQYVNHIENNINKLWETDLADWEFCYKGIGDWTKQKRDIKSAKDYWSDWQRRSS